MHRAVQSTGFGRRTAGMAMLAAIVVGLVAGCMAAPGCSGGSTQSQSEAENRDGDHTAAGAAGVDAVAGARSGLLRARRPGRRDRRDSGDAVGHHGDALGRGGRRQHQLRGRHPTHGQQRPRDAHDQFVQWPQLLHDRGQERPIGSVAELSGKSFAVSRVGGQDDALSNKVMPPRVWRRTRSTSWLSVRRMCVRRRSSPVRSTPRRMSLATWVTVQNEKSIKILVNADDYFNAVPLVNKGNAVTTKVLAEKPEAAAALHRGDRQGQPLLRREQAGLGRRDGQAAAGHRQAGSGVPVGSVRRLLGGQRPDEHDGLPDQHGLPVRDAAPSRTRRGSRPRTGPIPSSSTRC